MMTRVGRLVRGEILKLSAHPFLYGSLVALVAAVLLAGGLKPRLSGLKETEWAAFNSVQLFSYGFKFGTQVAGFLLVILSSMLFAGEFDRGTIKNLLTRPITRTDLFAAKTLTVILLAAFLYGFVFYVSLAYGLARGELGHVWDDTGYRIQKEFGEILTIARKAVLMSFVPFVAVGLMGVLISNLTESSGYAVAIACVTLVFGELVTGLVPGVQEKIFLFYASHMLDKLQQFGGGFSEMWNKDIEQKLLYLKVPLAYGAAFVAAAYACFRFRNITV